MMEFELNTTELQHLVIALIHVKCSHAAKERFAYNPAILENVNKLIELFASVNLETREESDYTATFNVTF